MPKKAEDFSLENLGKLSKKEIAKREEKEAHAEWVEGFKKRKKAEEEERAEDLESLGKRDKGAAAKSRASRQELEFEKTISERVEEAEEEERMRDIEKMREKITPEEEALEIEPEKTIEEDAEQISEQKGDKAMAEYLKHALSDHPELLTPEIKKNIDVITKQETIITKNEGNAKKDAQEKVRNAKGIIKKTEPAVKEYVKDIIKDYKESDANLNEVGEIYESAKNKLFSEKYDNYDISKGSITRFFKDRKLKKKLSAADYEEFEKLKLTYDDAFSRYGQLLKKHTKKYGRLEETLEAGTAFRIASRGMGSGKLPGVRGR